MKIAKISRSTLTQLAHQIELFEISEEFTLFPNSPDFKADYYAADAIYLSKRNVLALLSKLDRVKNGEHSYCSIIKRDTVHPEFPCSDEVTVMAVESDDEQNQLAKFIVIGVDDHLYYTERRAGDVHPSDLKE